MLLPVRDVALIPKPQEKSPKNDYHEKTEKNSGEIPGGFTRD